VLLAREVAQGLPGFDYVMASTVPRTLETAVAMGYAVDDLVKVPQQLAGQAMVVVGHLERWSWEFPWLRFRELAAEHEVVARYGEWLRDSWIAALDRVPEGGRALVVSHGRDIELGVLACLPDLPGEELKGWGEPVHQCEGVTMTFAEGRFELGSINRIRRCLKPG
jgi:broad specificity phosphatase PhoE